MRVWRERQREGLEESNFLNFRNLKTKVGVPILYTKDGNYFLCKLLFCWSF